MVTQPFEFEKHLRPPPRSFDVFFYVNVGVLALFLTLFTSKFVLAPGPTITVPKMSDAISTARTADMVVNLERDNLVLFEGGRYSMDGFRRRLNQIVAADGPKRLLLRGDARASYQALVTFLDVARTAGCEVQIAAESAGDH